MEASGALRSSFGVVATDYARHRPGYASDALVWALALAPGRRVLDIGAGTGKLTAVLQSLGHDVVAVEPDPAMLAELRRDLPEVRAVLGSAEEVPLPDDSVDAVVAGHALHWFDMTTAGPELARVLVPGGTLAGLWNVLDDSVDWVADVARVGGSAALGPRDLLSSWPSATVALHLPVDGAEARFGGPEQATFSHGDRRSVDSFVAKLATHAGVIVMPEQQRVELLNRIRDLLSRSSTADGQLDVPMFTAVLRTRRV